MERKPNLNKAKIVKTDVNIPPEIMKFMTPKAIEILSVTGHKEYGTGNLGIGEWFIVKGYVCSSYDKFKTEGSRTELSLYRLVGGCNNLLSFENPGAEKSEDYDSLSASQILDLPLDYGEAVRILLKNFLGKKVRVVARSAEDSDSYGKRYYLFAVDE